MFFSRRFACETHFKRSQFICTFFFHHFFRSPLKSISPQSPIWKTATNLNGRVLGRLSQCLASPWGIHCHQSHKRHMRQTDSASKSFTAMDASFPAWRVWHKKKTTNSVGRFRENDRFFSKNPGFCFWQFVLVCLKRPPESLRSTYGASLQTETGLDLVKFDSIKGWLVLSHSVVELGKL